jgi:hypothetical protein
MGALNIKKAIIPAAYAAIISVAYLAMPANPDPINVQWIWSWALE